MNKNCKHIRWIQFVVLYVLVALVTTSYAAINYWDGDTSTSWFDGANWSLGTVPGLGGDVQISSGTTYAPTLTNETGALNSLVLDSGQTLTVSGWNSKIDATTVTIVGTITHLENNVTTTNGEGQWVPLHRILLDGSNITIAASGEINADYLGYPPGAGPGAGGGIYGAAAHAGDGVRAYGGDTPGVAYGDPAAPEQPGSGGGDYVNSRQAGGAVKIIAEGTLTIDGEIRANGQNCVSAHGSGGSGGSIWLVCHTLAGASSGLVTVNGGNGSYYGSGASAGRIAMHYDTTAQAALPRPAVRFSAKYGTWDVGRNTGNLHPASIGTLYLPDSLFVTNTVLDGQRFQYTQLVIPEFTSWASASLTMDDCILAFPEGFDLDVSGDLIVTNGGGLYLFPSPVSDPLTEDGMLVNIGGNLLVYSDSWIHPYSAHTNGATVRFSITSDLIVAAGGGFIADDVGYDADNGPGCVVGGTGYSGAGHGGVGGGGFRKSPSGTTYGNPANPILPGSGGQGTKGGYGGGSIRLEVGGKAEIHGLLSAKCGKAVAADGPAGSGGTISIECETFQGSNSGLLRADGGWGNAQGGSGGGGRIAVMYDPVAQAGLGNPQPPVRFSTHAYKRSSVVAPARHAEMGTVCFPDLTLLTVAPTASLSLVDYRFWYTRLVVLNGFAAFAPASLIISNCVFTLPDGMDLDIAGDLTLASGGTLPSDLSVETAGAYGPAGPLGGLYIESIKTNTLYGARLDVGGNLRIGSDAWIFPGTCGTNGAVVGIKVGGDVVVDAGGGINANYTGYYTQLGNANGPGAGQDHYLGGGGYGGIGGGTYGGTNYGIAELPFELGSPAGWQKYEPNVSGDGGGAIHLLANGTLTINGTLTADGGNGRYYRGGAGSGGSIFLSCQDISGTGMLQANGGNSAYATGDSYGGGGRIAVWYGDAPNQVEARIATTNVSKLVFSYPYVGFSGDLDVLKGGGTGAGNGTRGFYRVSSPRGTLIYIR